MIVIFLVKTTRAPFYVSVDTNADCTHISVSSVITIECETAVSLLRSLYTGSKYHGLFILLLATEFAYIETWRPNILSSFRSAYVHVPSKSIIGESANHETQYGLINLEFVCTRWAPNIVVPNKLFCSGVHTMWYCGRALYGNGSATMSTQCKGMEMGDIAISAEYICATFKICRLHFYHDKLLLYTHLYGISEVILHAE